MRTHKIYQSYCTDPDDGRCLSWHTARRDAEDWVKREVRELEVGYDTGGTGKPGGVRRYLIPTTGKGLAGWLSIHFDRDNG